MTGIAIPLFETVAASLLNGFWISLVLIGLTAAILRLLDAHIEVNASTRYGVWTVLLAAVLAAHVIGAGFVDPVSFESESSVTAVQTEASTPREHADSRLRIDIPPAPPGPAGQSAGAGVKEKSPAVVQSHAERHAPQPPFESEGFVPPTADVDVSGWLFLLSAVLILIWISLATAGLASIVSSWRRVRALKSGARATDPSSWHHLVPAGLSRSFSVAESAEVSSPVAAGLLRPMILIPAGLRERLTADEFRQVLLHEVAHLERYDDWTILAQRIGEALFWHNPVMWLVSRELQNAREIACDDWVVSLTRRPEAYVHSIGRMIELNLGTRSMDLAPGLAAERGDLMSRMRRILNQKLPESPGLSGEQIAVAGGLVGLVLVLVAVFVPLTRLAFSIGDGEALTYMFGGSEAGVVQVQEMPRSEPLPPLAPLPALPDLPSLPALPALAPGAEAPPPPPRAASVSLRKPPPPPVSGSGAERTDASAPPVPADAENLSVRSWIRIMDAASGIGSNGERTQLLRTALSKMPDDDRVVRAWLEAVNNMNSSGARSELLVESVRSIRVDASRIEWIRSAASSIPSRGDRERVLRTLSEIL